MPASLLTQLLANAQQQTNQTQLHEAQYLLYHHQNHIRLIKPPQQTTTASVISPHQSSSDILLDIHSHGRMSAFWSDTDNTDEQGFRAYGVIGNLHRQPEICLRLGVYGYWFPIPLTTLFHPTADIQDVYLASKKVAGTRILPKISTP
jgi:PRTRC genetic system protein A